MLIFTLTSAIAFVLFDPGSRLPADKSTFVQSHRDDLGRLTLARLNLRGSVGPNLFGRRVSDMGMRTLGANHIAADRHPEALGRWNFLDHSNEGVLASALNVEHTRSQMPLVNKTGMHAASARDLPARRVVLQGMATATVVMLDGLGSRSSGTANALTQNSASIADAAMTYGSTLRYVPKDDVSFGAAAAMDMFYSLEFITYLCRFLLNYDTDSVSWWAARLAEIPPTLSQARQAEMREQSFAALAASVEFGLRRYPGTIGPALLLSSLEKQHGSNPEACRHLALLFSFLPENVQPIDGISSLLNKLRLSVNAKLEGGVSGIVPFLSPGLPQYLSRNLTALLPSKQLPVKNERGFYEVRGLTSLISEFDEDRQGFRRVRSTVFGPCSEIAGQERALRPTDFALFSLAGTIGCAGTHSAVIPLDVVKTRLQTSPGKYLSIQDGFSTIFKSEGVGGLLLGATPTLLGYMYYGATVYPGFEFFRRLFEDQLGPANADSLHAPIVLLAGASATVAACFGVCPAEVLRIRMVAKPATYSGNNLRLALEALSAEAEAANTPLIKLLYSGFRPLVIRQVIFGMIKFFTFDSCVDAILEAFPKLGESSQTELLVSLGAGLVAGVVSSLVSQPADTVLSRMNRGSAFSTTAGRVSGGTVKQPLGVLATVRTILDEYGPAGLYLGAATRCVWSGAIISGQFFFYDLARQVLSVSPSDLRLLLDVNLE